MWFSVLTRKARSPDNFYPTKVQSWLRGGKSQLQAPSGPGPQMPPSRHCWGRQMPRIQSALRPPRHRGQVPRLRPRQTAAATRSQRWGCRRGSPMLQGLGLASAWPWWGLWSLAGHSHQPVPGSQLSLWPKAGWARGPPRERGKDWDPPLTSDSARQPPLRCPLAEWTTNGHWLIIGHLEAGPLRHWPMAEQDH